MQQPRTMEFQNRYLTSPKLVYELVLRIAKDNTIDGFTYYRWRSIISNKPDLRQLIMLLRTISEDIMVYTGYSIRELSDVDLDGIAVLY